VDSCPKVRYYIIYDIIWLNVFLLDRWVAKSRVEENKTARLSNERPPRGTLSRMTETLLCVEIFHLTHPAMCMWRSVKIRSRSHLRGLMWWRLFHKRASYLRRSSSLSQRDVSWWVKLAKVTPRRTSLLVRKGPFYLSIQFTLGTVLAHQEGAWLVGLHSTFGKLCDLEFVCIAHRRWDVNLVRRVRDVLIVELDSHPIFTWKQAMHILIN